MYAPARLHDSNENSASNFWEVMQTNQNASPGASGDRPALKPVIDSARQVWFEAWARQWKNETSALSSINQKMAHPAIQGIMRMGSAALPLILRDLEQQTYHWFPALKILAGGHDPVPLQHRGDVAEMKRAWLEWGRTKRLI